MLSWPTISLTALNPSEKVLLRDRLFVSGRFFDRSVAILRTPVLSRLLRLTATALTLIHILNKERLEKGRRNDALSSLIYQE